MRTVVRLTTFLAAILAIAPASAELYKWVDERGVTNYSNEPPAAAPANKLARVANTISVYTPDENFMRAVKAVREKAILALSEPEPPRSPVARISTQQSGYDQCLMSGRLGCDDLYRSYQPAYYLPAAVYPLRGVQPTRFLTPRAAPDMTRVRGGTVLR